MRYQAQWYTDLRKEDFLFAWETMRAALFFFCIAVYPAPILQYFLSELTYLATVLDVRFWIRLSMLSAATYLILVIVGQKPFLKLMEHMCKTADYIHARYFDITSKENWEANKYTKELKSKEETFTIENAWLKNAISFLNESLSTADKKLKTAKAEVKNLVYACTCPISKDLFNTPIMLQCGHVFELKALEETFTYNSTRCPFCDMLMFVGAPKCYVLQSVAEIAERLDAICQDEEWAVVQYTNGTPMARIQVANGAGGGFPENQTPFQTPIPMPANRMHDPIYMQIRAIKQEQQLTAKRAPRARIGAN